MLTDRQTEVVGGIQDWIKEKGYSPTTRELASRLGVRSTAVVHDHLVRLKAAGIVDWVPNQARTLRVIGGGD